MNTFIIWGAQYLIFLIALAAFLFWLQQNTRTKKEIFIYAIITFVLIYATAKLGGFLYNNPRPFVDGHFTPLIAHKADNGFPSDHTLLGAAVASIFFIYKKPLGIVLLGTTTIMGICRVAAGVHHATDIIGSVIIATTVTSLTHTYILPRIRKYFHHA